MTDAQGVWGRLNGIEVGLAWLQMGRRLALTVAVLMGAGATAQASTVAFARQTAVVRSESRFAVVAEESTASRQQGGEAASGISESQGLLLMGAGLFGAAGLCVARASRLQRA